MAPRENEKSPPEAGLSLRSYDDEGGINPRPHAPFDNLFSSITAWLSTKTSLTGQME
jgi:hypothetical protein